MIKLNPSVPGLGEEKCYLSHFCDRALNSSLATYKYSCAYFLRNYYTNSTSKMATQIGALCLSPHGKQRQRMARHRENKGRPERFTMEFPGGAEVREEIQDKMKHVKKLMGAEGCSKTIILNKLLDYWLEQNTFKPSTSPKATSSTVTLSNSYTACPRSESTQDMFIVCKSSIENLCARIHEHATQCNSQVAIINVVRKGHSAIFTLECRDRHNFKWNSSPYLPNGKFLVNFRMAHAFYSSGLLPNQYERIMTTAGLGVMQRDY